MTFLAQGCAWVRLREVGGPLDNAGEPAHARSAITGVQPMDDKLLSMGEAVTRWVHDGDVLAIEGFTSGICFAAAHEIIRQGRKDLTLCRMTPDLVYDQMVAAGCARKMVFSYLGNPGVGSLHCIRRAVEKGIPRPLELEEYTHFGMIGRYLAGASRLPFYPLRTFTGSDLPGVNPQIRFVADPYGGGRIAGVPPLSRPGANRGLVGRVGVRGRQPPGVLRQDTCRGVEQAAAGPGAGGAGGLRRLP